MNRIVGLVAAFVLLGPLSGCEQKGGPVRVDRADPEQGATGGGDQVSILGSGFEPGKTQVEVRFGRRRAEQVLIASSSRITVVSPPGERGPVDITLMFDDGKPFKIAGGFKYVAPSQGGDVRKAFFSGQAGANQPAHKP